MNQDQNKPNLAKLKSIATQTLDELITPHGIYASSSKGSEGVYHGFFGRDTIITASLVVEAESISGKLDYTADAVRSVLQLGLWQGKHNNVATGEEKGKIPHEVRIDQADYWHLTEGALKNGFKPWYVDPVDHVMKNWDSVDSTPMWIWAVANFYEAGLIEETKMPWQKLKSGLNWCARNLKDFHGYTGFSYDPNREWGGLFTKTWKDSHGAYLSEETGKILNRPLYDVWASGLVWAALQKGKGLFAQKDSIFASKMGALALDLKTRFNTLGQGFVMLEENGLLYLAESMDCHRQIQKAVCVDPALCLWSNVNGESIVFKDLVACVTERVMRPDMFDSMAGVRIYSSRNRQFDPLAYHRGPNTYWPFVSALVAKGMSDYGLQDKAAEVLTAMLVGVEQFGTCIELFLGQDGKFERYKDPHSGNYSCSDQAWSAAGVLYAVAFLESLERQENTYELQEAQFAAQV